MPFTDVLGTSDSRAGNIIPGFIGSFGSTFNKSLTSNLVLSQTVACQKILNFSVSHTLGLTEAINRQVPESASNSLTWAQTVDFLVGKFVFGTNSIAFSQALAVEKDVMRTLNSSLVLTHTAGRNIIKLVSPTNTLTFSQTTHADVTKPASNTIAFSQTATVSKVKGAKNTLEFGQFMSVQLVLVRQLNSFFGMGHQAITGPNTFRRSLTSTLNLTQSAIGNSVKGINQTLTFTQTVVVNRVKGAENTFVIGQSAFYQALFTRSPSDVLILSQSVLVNKIKRVSATSIFAPISGVKKTKIITQTASNAFGLTQELLRSRFFENLSQTITFSQLAEHERTALPNTPPQAVAFNQSVKLNKVLNLHCSNQLVFKNSFEKRIMIGDQTVITVPEVQVVKVKNIVVLRGETLAITLPAPEFDDSEAFTGAVNIIRFKTGNKRVYKTDTDQRVIEYTFTIERKKKDELKYFITLYNSRPFYMENWKGEIWYVRFNNNPFVFNEEGFWEDNPITGGNKYTISLSFEGVRIN